VKIYKAAILAKMEARASPKSHALIFAWRKEVRVRLIAHRLAIDANDRRQHSVKIAQHLSHLIEPLFERTVSFYWPFRGEPDLRPLMQTVLEGGGRCALPVVVEKKAPLVFRLWQPGRRLVPGVWNIPIPADGDEVLPDVVIAPVVGFDSACYRLGYGGGFFDRTLAALPDALAIGVGYDAAAISTIYPLPHDVPMEAIVTERGILKPRSDRKPQE
jgi:5,10-methenyltetrahydrofolate synthetase